MMLAIYSFLIFYCDFFFADLVHPQAEPTSARRRQGLQEFHRTWECNHMHAAARMSL